MSDIENSFVQLLEEKGITRKQVADALGVDVRNVYRWLSGDRKPMFSISQVKSLCELLDEPIQNIPDDFSRNNNS